MFHYRLLEIIQRIKTLFLLEQYKTLQPKEFNFCWVDIKYAEWATSQPTQAHTNNYISIKGVILKQRQMCFYIGAAFG